MGIIYCATNKLNGKMYIGKTIGSLAQRISGHVHTATKHPELNNYFHNSLRTYGNTNFSWRILDYAETEESLNELEKIYIDLFSTSCSSCGYNTTHGGDGQIPNEETREKMSRCHRGQVPYNKGKERTAEEKKSISEALLASSANKEAGYRRRGIPLPVETKQKLSAAMKGRKRPWSSAKCTCAVCGLTFMVVGTVKKYCPECVSKYSREQLKTIVREKIGKEKLKEVPWITGLKHSEESIKRQVAARMAHPASIKCKNCGTIFEAPNISFRYCAACRAQRGLAKLKEKP